MGCGASSRGRPKSAVDQNQGFSKSASKDSLESFASKGSRCSRFSTSSTKTGSNGGGVKVSYNSTGEYLGSLNLDMKRPTFLAHELLDVGQIFVIRVMLFNIYGKEWNDVRIEPELYNSERQRWKNDKKLGLLSATANGEFPLLLLPEDVRSIEGIDQITEYCRGCRSQWNLEPELRMDDSSDVFEGTTRQKDLQRAKGIDDVITVCGELIELVQRGKKDLNQIEFEILIGQMKVRLIKLEEAIHMKNNFFERKNISIADLAFHGFCLLLEEEIRVEEMRTGGDVGTREEEEQTNGSSVGFVKSLLQLPFQAGTEPPEKYSTPHILATVLDLLNNELVGLRLHQASVNSHQLITQYRTEFPMCSVNCALAPITTTTASTTGNFKSYQRQISVETNTSTSRATSDIENGEFEEKLKRSPREPTRTSTPHPQKVERPWSSGSEEGVKSILKMF